MFSRARHWFGLQQIAPWLTVLLNIYLIVNGDRTMSLNSEFLALEYVNYVFSLPVI